MIKLPGSAASFYAHNTCERVTQPCISGHPFLLLQLASTTQRLVWITFIAALEHNDHVCEVTLQDLSFSQLGEAVATMQQSLIIPRVGISRASHGRRRGVGPSRSILEWICITSCSSYFLHHRSYFCRPQSFSIFPIPGTSHPSQCSFIFPALASLEKLWIEFYSREARLYCHCKPTSTEAGACFLPALSGFRSLCLANTSRTS